MLHGISALITLWLERRLIHYAFWAFPHSQLKLIFSCMVQSLLFLPDISGFTRFVKHTEIEHSQHIISELLELLIDANMLDLELAEVEGDALFFYKHDDIPSRQALLQQIEEMYIRFHNHLQLYEKQRICECGACSSAASLNLKFIVHGGEFGFIKVKDQHKPYGQDVIIAHRLMKNQVPIDDYALFSAPLAEAWKEDESISLREPLIPHNGAEQYEEVGSIPYQYVELTPLRRHVSPPPPVSLGDRTANPLTIEAHIGKPVEEVFELVSNFEYRLKWNTEVDKLEYDPDRVNRVGAKHTCVINNRLVDFETVSNDFGENALVYGERTQSVPLLEEMTQYFILKPDETGGTQIRLELHPRPHKGLKGLIYPLVKGFFGKQLRKALASIKRAAENGMS